MLLSRVFKAKSKRLITSDLIRYEYVIGSIILVYSPGAPQSLFIPLSTRRVRVMVRRRRRTA